MSAVQYVRPVDAALTQAVGRQAVSMPRTRPMLNARAGRILARINSASPAQLADMRRELDQLRAFVDRRVPTGPDIQGYYSEERGELVNLAGDSGTHGGVIPSQAVAIPDNAVAGQTFDITWSPTLLARLTDVPICGFGFYVDYGGFNAVADAWDCDISVLQNEFPMRGLQRAPLPVVATDFDPASNPNMRPNVTRLSAPIMLVGRDELVTRVTVNANLSGGGAGAATARAVAYASTVACPR